MTGKYRRTLWIALVLPSVLAVAILLSAPRSVQTCTIEQRCGSEVFYFSDASHTIQVGYRAWDCDCEFYYWGTTTNHWDWYPMACC